MKASSASSSSTGEVGGADGIVGLAHRDIHHADVGQLGAGGGEQGVAHGGVFVGGGLDICQGGVGVAVDEDVDARHLFQQVDGAVAGGLDVDAQVAQADDEVTAGGLQGVHLGLGAGKQVLAGQEGDPLDLGGGGPWWRSRGCPGRKRRSWCRRGR